MIRVLQEPFLWQENIEALAYLHMHCVYFHVSTALTDVWTKTQSSRFSVLLSHFRRKIEGQITSEMTPRLSRKGTSVCVGVYARVCIRLVVSPCERYIDVSDGSVPATKWTIANLNNARHIKTDMAYLQDQSSTTAHFYCIECSFSISRWQM